MAWGAVYDACIRYRRLPNIDIDNDMPRLVAQRSSELHLILQTWVRFPVSVVGLGSSNVRLEKFSDLKMYGAKIPRLSL